jgi:AraC-like DNA-binding protein
VLVHRVLAESSALRVTEVCCSGGHSRWSPPELATSFAIVLPRRGVFRRRVAGTTAVIDPATGYVQVPGTEQQISHPAGGDVCTTITFSTWADHDHPAVSDGPARLTPRLGLAHRLLLARAARADPVELADLATDLAAAVLAGGQQPRGHTPAQRDLVDGARAILAAEPGCPLPEVAGRLAVSPWYLSRLFHDVTGTTLRRFRIRLRVIAALDRLAALDDGTAAPPSLAALATEVGFADQAHLTRVLRAETGQPPGRLRSLLTP